MLKKLAAFPPASFALEVVHTYLRVGVARSAAALSYFLILTLFPLLLCVNYFIGLFHLDLEQALSALDQLLPPQVLTIMEEYLSYAAEIQSPALLAVGMATILVSASAGIRTLFLTMDELYQVRRNNGILRFMLSLGLSLLFLLTIYLSVVVIFTGDWFFGFLQANLPPRVAELLPLSALGGVWTWIRYLLLFCFFFLLVLVLYRVGTPRGAAGQGMVLGAAMLTSLAMVACSILFSWFIGLSSRYALVYGSLASLIILLVWLYFCGNILLIGAVVGKVGAGRIRGGRR